MGLICGWAGKSNPANPEATIAAMLKAPAGFLDYNYSFSINEQTALGGGATDNTTPCQANDICCVIEGSPRWSDAELQSIQDKMGASHALAKGFERYGKAVLGKLFGAFSLCILKPKAKYALLAIDRVGIRPLAYTVTHDTLIFGTYIDCILSHPQFKSEIDPQGIFNYLYFHMIPSPQSAYRGVVKLEPGEYVECSEKAAVHNFYSITDFTDTEKSEAALAAQLRNELDLSVRSCLSGAMTGTFLSGGLDSSTVTGVFGKISTDQVNAFSIGFDAEGYDEMAFARASARYFGATLHEYYVTPADVLDAIPKMAAAYDEPFGNASAIPAYYCAKFARESGFDTLLAGDGGDEIFAGNTRYVKQLVFDLYRHIPALLKKSVIEPAAFNIRPLRKLKSYIEQATIPMPARMETYNFLHRTPLSDIFESDFLSRIDSNFPAAHLEAIYNRPDQGDLLKRMLFLDQKLTLADNDIRKVNRMCELAGTQVHYPLLQDRMIEFAAHIPSAILVNKYKLRSFFRKALKDSLPPETLSKSKHGFGLPFGIWINEDKQLKEFVDVNLKGISQRGIINEEYISRIILAHEHGHASYYGVMIWLLVMLEQWFVAHNQ